MRLIAFLFALIKQFTPVNDMELVKLKNEAEEWEAKALLEPKAGETDPRNGAMKLYARAHKPWGVRLALAVFYWPTVRWWMSSNNAEEDERYKR